MLLKLIQLSARDYRPAIHARRLASSVQVSEGLKMTREPSITGPETKQVPHPVPAPKTRKDPERIAVNAV
jgi:hypothetical protein